MARKVILPGDVAAKGGLTIHVPSGYESERDVAETGDGFMYCSVVVDLEGTLCGAIFQPGEERDWQHHVGECAHRHIDFIRAASPRARLPWLDPNAWDPEVEEHMKKVGETMKAEGRWEVKPSERAGF